MAMKLEDAEDKQRGASKVLKTEGEHRSQGKKKEFLTSSQVLLCNPLKYQISHTFQIYEMHVKIGISHVFHIHEIWNKGTRAQQLMNSNKRIAIFDRSIISH